MWSKIISFLKNIFRINNSNTNVDEEVSCSTLISYIEGDNMSSVNKYALLIGINKYLEPGNDLSGCVNDTEDIWELLIKKYNFKADNIRVLNDSRATKNNILDRLEWLISSLKSGDIAFLQYSGHGSYVRDRNNDELDDSRDEIFCPYNFDWDDPLTDDILAEYFKRIPDGAFLFFISDSCHSGTINRGSFSNPHPKEGDFKNRFIMPPFDIDARCRGRELKTASIGRRISSKAKDNVSYVDQKHLLISGCRDNQTSADAYIGSRWNGALTRTLIDIIDDDENMSLLDIHKELIKRLKDSEYTQVPQLNGPKDILNKTVSKILKC